MPPKTLRIATRQSPLALWQAHHVRSQLAAQWPQLTIELLPLVTSGDRFLKDRLLAAGGGKGLFVKELEEALLDGRADLAVHSTKDMPADCPEGLVLGAICKRDNPFDAFVSDIYPDLEALPIGAKVGTSSLRRQSQLLAYRPDLQVLTLRGNIQTRLEKLHAKEYDAIILAASGLLRMQLQNNIRQILSDEIMLPSCGQGALSIEYRAQDKETGHLIACLNDANSALCVHTERLVNAQLGGHCHVPLAVFCTIQADKLLLRAKILKNDGSQIIEDSQQGSPEQASFLAAQCTQSLKSKGAFELLFAIPS